MKKYIHYCWFGTNPLPKLAKKCIKSWKKYLPDYEIKCWNETNVNLEECPFIKEAYENKKWAFVADYARTKALYEYGGIYFDTDVLITKPIDFLLDNTTFLGIEDSNMINAAVWGEKKPKSWFATQMLNFYQSQEHFNKEDIYSISIPRIITRILNKYGFDYSKDEVQVLNDSVYVYPREYFYPLSYNYRNNVFTENTCMIHYFDASWIPKWEQRENKIIRKFGEKKGLKLINYKNRVKNLIKKCLKVCLFPFVLYRRYKRKITDKYKQSISNAISEVEKYHGDYIVFHNPEWFGVTNATIELFENRIPCGEILRKKDIKKIGDLIINNDITQVIFSAMCIGWKDLAIYLRTKAPNIKIKTFWHGNHSQVSEPYGWARNLEIIDLHKKGIIDVMGTCKKSIMEFYQKEGYKAFFITNKVDISKLNLKFVKKKNNQKIRIGMYAAKSDDWRKNMFAQMAAVTLIDNAVLDIVPLNDEVKQYARHFNIDLDGCDKSLPRKELIERMSENDVNLYVTFSECSPMLPLESFSVNVPCLTGNNHHYFIGTELEKYLVVKNEASINEIKDKILLCLNNKDKVLKLYEKEFDKINAENCKNNVKEFLEM